MTHETTHRRRKTAFRNIRSYLLVALGVLVLAAVILSVSALSAPRTAPVATGDSSPAKSAGDTYYREALAALRSNDVTAATNLLGKALQADPANVDAKTVLDRLKDQRDLPSKETSKTQPAPDDVAFSKPVSDLGRLLPKQVGGYDVGRVEIEGADAVVPLDPATAATAARVSRVLLSVHDRGSKARAQAFVDDLKSVVYTKGGSGLTAHGTPARFGSDGTHLAAVFFVRGRFAFEAVLTGTGADPATLKDLAQQVADSFPTKP